MKKFLPFFIFCFGFLFLQNTFSETVDNTTKLPYKVDFTEKELKLLNSLDQPTLIKLILIAQNLMPKKISTASNTASTTPTLFTNNQTTQTPYYNPQTGQYQNKPFTPQNQTQTQQNQNPYLNNNNNNNSTGQNSNPYLGNNGNNGSNGSSNPYLGNQSGQNGNQGNQQQGQTPPPLTGGNIDVKDIDPMCQQGYGIDAGGSCPDVERLTDTVKQTAMEACTLIKKKISSQSQYRSESCNTRVGGAGSSSHMSGMALDINVNNLSSTERQTVFLKFKQKGFDNIGCYRAGSGNVHLDHRPGGPRRWGSSYHSDTFNASNCPPELIQVFGE